MSRAIGFGQALVASLGAAFLFACGAISDEPDCSVAAQKDFVLDVMTDDYLWSEQVEPQDPNDFETPEDLLDALRFSELDRWSRISTVRQVRRLFDEGVQIGAGYSARPDGAGSFWIAQVIPGSPADEVGLLRGMRIISINGVSVEEIEAEDLWGTVTGPREIGVELFITTEDSGGNVDTYDIVKDEFPITTVSEAKVIAVDGMRIAYLAFHQFLEPSLAELREAFSSFRDEGADALVADLRYNPGGRLSAATELGSLIIGRAYEGQPFIVLEHNARHQDRNETLELKKLAESAGFERIAFITSPGTASASEAVVQGMKPYAEVGVIGDRTHGKPVGANTFTRCEMALSPVTFRVVDARGQGNYFDGLAADCPAPDDLTRELGDPEEARLAEALAWVSTGSCRPAVEPEQAPPVLDPSHSLMSPLAHPF